MKVVFFPPLYNLSNQSSATKIIWFNYTQMKFLSAFCMCQCNIHRLDSRNSSLFYCMFLNTSTTLQLLISREM